MRFSLSIFSIILNILEKGIDTSAGKNLLGLFYDPIGIFMAAEWCKTLSQRHWTNGMAEVIKTALLMPEADLYYLLESQVEVIRHRPESKISFDICLQVIHACAQKKAQIVEMDAKEAGGIRTLLNLGHSIGHAVETLMMPGNNDYID